MIEAVNSVLSSAPLLRGNAEQVSSAQALDVASGVDTQGAVNVPKAPYISPYISVDLDSNKAVLQIRDSETGDIVQQFPSEHRLRQHRSEIVAQQQSSSEPSGSGEVDDSGDSGEVAGSGSGGDVAQSQAASEALSTGAQAGSEGESAGVSVLA